MERESATRRNVTPRAMHPANRELTLPAMGTSTASSGFTRPAEPPQRSVDDEMELGEVRGGTGEVGDVSLKGSSVDVGMWAAGEHHSQEFLKV